MIYDNRAGLPCHSGFLSLLFECRYNDSDDHRPQVGVATPFSSGMTAGDNAVCVGTLLSRVHVVFKAAMAMTYQ